MSPSPDGSARWRRAAAASLLALALLEMLWELWLAPLKPGGSWLVLKVLPLLAKALLASAWSSGRSTD